MLRLGLRNSSALKDMFSQPRNAQTIRPAPEIRPDRSNPVVIDGSSRMPRTSKSRCVPTNMQISAAIIHSEMVLINAVRRVPSRLTMVDASRIINAHTSPHGYCAISNRLHT